MKKFDIEYVKDYCNKKGLKCISDKYTQYDEIPVIISKIIKQQV